MNSKQPTNKGSFGIREKNVCKKCGAKRVDRQLGSEATIEEYVDNMVKVFREVHRILRDDGVLWLNLGDSYSGGSRGGDGGDDRGNSRLQQSNQGSAIRARKKTDLPSGNLCGIPWRVALALQADGWILRQDIIWCLSGGSWVYSRTQKGDMPMMVRDMARLDPSTVQLWNGKKWTKLLGMSRSSRKSDELELVLRSGERISCTPNHKFPTNKGLLEAAGIRVGDCLTSCQLPEPDRPRRPKHIDLEAAWFAGLYLAEGCGVDVGKIQIAGHAKEKERWLRVRRIVRSYGGHCFLVEENNTQSIRVSGKLVCSLIRELVSGNGAKNKCFSPTVWRYGNDFLESMMEGYLEGDGSKDKKWDRWRLGFCRNYNLERDLRVACARLGWSLTLRTDFADFDGRKFPSFRGEIRKIRRGHHNEKNRNEVTEIRKARCREVYDLGVEDEPHLFALASGVLTHNSKPNPMPESVQDRCTKSHEYVFLLSKKVGYFCDMEAIREEGEGYGRSEGSSGFRAERYTNNNSANNSKVAKTSGRSHTFEGGRNKRSVWTVTTQGYPGAHFATFPPKLITPMVKAGTSLRGCCPTCQAPWERVVGRERKPTRPGVESKVYLEPPVHPDSPVRTHKGDVCGNRDPQRHCTESTTMGWRPGCKCYGLEIIEDIPPEGIKQREGEEDTDFRERKKKWLAAKEKWPKDWARLKPQYDKQETIPCTVLDPFAGACTTNLVCNALGRYSIGIELNPEYLEMGRKRLLNKGNVPREKKGKKKKVGKHLEDWEG